MTPTRIPTLFAQIMGLVVASLFATAVVSFVAVWLAPPQPETFNLQDVVNALNAGKNTRTDNGRVLEVTVRDLPPIAAAGADDEFRSNEEQWVASQVKRPDATRLNGDRVRLYSPPQPSFMRTVLARAAGVQPRGGGPGGRGGGGRGGGPGDRGPGAGGGPPGAPNAAAGAQGRGGPQGRGELGRGGRNALAAEMVETLAPMMSTPEQKAAIEAFRERLPTFTPQNSMTMARIPIGPKFKVAIQRDDGKWLTIQPKTTLSLSSWQISSLGILLISIALVSPFAWLLARRLSAPIVTFAAAAERLGRDPRSPPLELRGSAEVRAAVVAFNEMQVKLRRYVEDRTAMVAAIAHDLRTPLTRIRFRVDALPDDIRPKLEADIDQMDEMISSTLAFARDAAMPNQRVKLDLTSLVQTVFDQAEETGAPASFKANPGKHVVVEGDPLSLKRLFTNLVDNAIKYGKRAHGHMSVENGMAVIEVDDEGPGIPEADLQRVFEPFYRRESSRNRETGGTGLGLAVVRSIALAHGGDVTLRNRTKGGLTARVTLPL